jgi:hypothetical protein
MKLPMFRSLVSLCVPLFDGSLKRISVLRKVSVHSSPLMPIDRVSVTARYSAAEKLTFVGEGTGVDQTDERD